jgi:hypothetical protein
VGTYSAESNGTIAVANLRFGAAPAELIKMGQIVLQEQYEKNTFMKC